MNILTGILAREHLSNTDSLNIVWMATENKPFYEFMVSLGHNLLSYEDLYFGYNNPHIVICNNKLYQFTECLSISVKYHLPSIVIDHAYKHDMLDPTKIEELNNIPCCYKIAINQKISDSWGKIHDAIMSYDINSEESISKWQNMLYQSAKRIYTI
jgi:hypothetical protein